MALSRSVQADRNQLVFNEGQDDQIVVSFTPRTGKGQMRVLVDAPKDVKVRFIDRRREKWIGEVCDG